MLPTANKERLAQIFDTLVRIDSPTGSERELAVYTASYFQQRDLVVSIDPSNNVFARVPGIGEPLLFAAHLDTVEPGRGIRPKFDGRFFRSSGDTILGADNKATLAAILETVDVLREAGVSHRPLELLFNTAEETTNSGARGFDYSQLTARKGVIADIAEPVGTVVLTSPGYARFDIEIEGRASHAAYPERGVSVIPSLALLLSKLPNGYLGDDSILNIGFLNSGDARNTRPGLAVLRGEIRSFNKDDSLTKNLTYVEELAKRNTFNGVSLRFSCAIDNQAYVFLEEDPYVREIARVLEEVVRVRPEFIKPWSCSDANIFNNEGGLTVVNIGDGTKNTHTKDESVALEDMAKLTQVFLSLATRI